MSRKSILLLSQFETQIRDVIFGAKICHIKSSELSSKFDKIREEVYSKTASGRSRYDRWTQGAVCGMIQYASNSLWEKVEFCYRDAQGTIFSTEKDSIHRSTEEFYASWRGCELGEMECAHIWRGTDKPYTAWKRI